MASIFYIIFIEGNSIRHLTRLYKASKNFNNVTQVAFMKTLAIKPHKPKPAPYPYWKRQCTNLHMTFDLTSLRYDENSKVIVVDGPPAVGKTKLCEQIAKEFGLLYMPPPVFDDLYINYYGFDLRSLNSKLEDKLQFRDLTNFLRDPNHIGTAMIQFGIFLMRLEQYMNALVHVLATGQGVVLNRCIFTEAGFMHAMYNSKYISKQVVKQFDIMRTNIFHLLLKPHLIIYLEATPETVLERIKKRGNIDEINSKVFTNKFLSDLDTATKQKCLSWLSPHSEILIYDCNKEDSDKDIIYDIEKLDLEEGNEKFNDWVFTDTNQLIRILEMYHTKNAICSQMFHMKTSKYALELLHVKDDHGIIEKLLEEYAVDRRPKYDKVPWYVEDNIFIYSVYRRRCRDFINCDMFKLSY